MIKLLETYNNIITEGVKEKSAEALLSDIVKNSPWKGKAYIAGGYVRDEVMGLEPKDIDITVAAENGGIELATYIVKQLGIYKEGSNPVIYPKFGTAKITLRGIEYNNIDLSDMDIEFVMTRKERYTDNSRKPDVEYGTLQQDTERRDFTINSLLKDLTTGEIIDMTGMGKDDIKKGLIRTPLDPDIIFSEDPLRMLRAIRFSCKYKWNLPMFMIKALKKNADKLKNISVERIREELDKMLVSSIPDRAIRLLQITGLSQYIFPELDALIGMKQNKYHSYDAMTHTLQVLKQVPPTVIDRLSALFHDIGKVKANQVIGGEIHFYDHEDIGADMARDILFRLKYPNDIINAVYTCVKNHMRTKQWKDDISHISDKAIRKLKNEIGPNLNTLLNLIDADNKSHGGSNNIPNQVTNIKNRMQNIEMGGDKMVLPINGDDIMKILNIKPGVEVKNALEFIKDKWLENPGITREEAIYFLKQKYL